MRFCVLSSGSKANCTVFESVGVRILIDCGLSARETEKRLLRSGIDPNTIDAILVTHEHYDHVNGIRVFSKRFKVPVYANHATARELRGLERVERFKTGESFWLGGVKVSPFSIIHDAVDPVGYSLMAEGLKFTQVTDLGRVTPIVQEYVRDANALVLESNHDQEMLQNCDYSWELKKRISSSHGHLSNDTAGNLLRDVHHSGLSQVVLAHLSENSNTPKLALDTVRGYVSELSLPIIAACVQCETPLFQVGEQSNFASSIM